MKIREAVTVIDIVTQVTDDTASGAKSAEKNVSKLEKSIMKLGKQIQGIKGKSKLEVMATLKDKASKGIQGVAAAGKKIAGTKLEVAATLKDKASKGIQGVAAAGKKIAETKLEITATLKDKASKGIQGVIAAGKKIAETKLEIAAMLKDKASKGIQGIKASGKKIAGKVWTVTLKARDLVTAPFKKVLGLISNPMTQMAAFAGISFGLADTVKTGMDFESAMASAAATSGIDKTSKDYEKMEKAARQAGATTTKTAAESANALEYMALAGWDVDTSIQALPSILRLSEATGMDLARTSDMITDSMAALGLTVDELPTYLDKVAKAQNSSNQSAEQLLEAYLGVGGQFKNLGIDVTESATALGVMANRGLKGSEAATALNAVLINLTTGAGEAGDMMEHLGISAFDESGKFIGLQNVLLKVNQSMAGMTDKQKNATLAALGGKVHVDDLNKLLAGLNETNVEGVTEWDALAASIDNSRGSLEKMAKTKTDTLAGSLAALQSAASEVQISISKKLEPYVRGMVDWLTAHMPDVQNTVGQVVDFVLNKIDSVTASIQSLTASPEWQNAETLWDKIQLAWDKLIAEPFDSWWNGTGKTWLSDKAQGIGEGLGIALNKGIMALLGIDVGDGVTDGMSIGKSFADGFAEGFDGKKVAEAVWKGLKDSLKNLFKDAGKLLPGGENSSATSMLSAGIIGIGAAKIGKTAYKAYKGGKALVNGGKAIGKAIGNISGISDGIEIFNAAKNGGAAAQSAASMAEAGVMGHGVKLGTKLAKIAPKLGGISSKVAKGITKAAPILAGVTSVIEMGVDAYHGIQKATEWTGSDSIGAKVASGIGAALGGTGDGVTGKQSDARKALNVGTGALKGAGIGAAIGSFIPGVGTAIGAGVGGAVGAAGAAIGGSNIAKGLSSAGSAIKGFFAKTVPDTIAEEAEDSFMKALPETKKNIITKTMELFDNAKKASFSKTVPDTFTKGTKDSFMEALPKTKKNMITKTTEVFDNTKKASFAKTVPDTFTKGTKDSFTRTLSETKKDIIAKTTEVFDNTKEKTGEICDSISDFFTENLPVIKDEIQGRIDNFFHDTKTQIDAIWDDVKMFITETAPKIKEEIKNGITNFFNNIREKINGIWGNVQNTFSSDFRIASIKGATAKHADGGILTSPHVGLVAEDGAEAIIPLSSKRRNRGLNLWEQAGRLLGVKPYAEGGITKIPISSKKPEGSIGVDKNPPLEVHSSSKTSPSPEFNPPPLISNGVNPSVTIQNLTFEINMNGADTPDAQSLVETIKENVRGMTDEIAYQLAVAMQQVYANTPKTSWE
ncbi:MAG: phage tail tape measure protein [Hungatella sp.]|nr:phage tail tape measure protein [Hungatella sp.]